MRRARFSPRLLGAAVVLAALAGCRQDMHDQPRIKPLSASTFFSDGRGSRPLVEGTVARGWLRDDVALYTGKVNGKLVDELPFPATKAVLERGRQRFDIYCSPCHGQVGNGRGVVVLRGYTQPPSYHVDRLRQAPVGHFFDVITNGFGAMPDYAAQVPVNDRWAIAAYIRVLQRSQRAQLADVPAYDRPSLDGGPPAQAPSGHAKEAHE